MSEFKPGFDGRRDSAEARLNRGRKRPTEGFTSVAAYRRWIKEERLKDVAQRVKLLESAKLKRDQHYGRWIAECCVTRWNTGTPNIECSVTSLRASYVAWCARQGGWDSYQTSAVAWGGWMGQRYIKVARNTKGIGRVYLGIVVRPAGDPGAAI